MNSDPGNPEIDIRAYSDQAERIAEYAAATCRGFKAVKLSATGKHFPGRGHSAMDAHCSVPVIDVDMDTLWNRDLLPYRHLVELELLPSVMLAHTIYPVVDPEAIATVSRKLIAECIWESTSKSSALGVSGSARAGGSGYVINPSFLAKRHKPLADNNFIHSLGRCVSLFVLGCPG